MPWYYARDCLVSLPVLVCLLSDDFVEMESRESAEAAIASLNGHEIDGRALTVNEARPKESRAPRGGGRGFGGGGGRGGFNRDRGGRGNRY